MMRGNAREPVVHRHAVLQDWLDLLDTQETFSGLGPVVNGNRQEGFRGSDVAVVEMEKGLFRSDNVARVPNLQCRLTKKRLPSKLGLRPNQPRSYLPQSTPNPQVRATWAELPTHWYPAHRQPLGSSVRSSNHQSPSRWGSCFHPWSVEPHRQMHGRSTLFLRRDHTNLSEGSRISQTGFRWLQV